MFVKMFNNKLFLYTGILLILSASLTFGCSNPQTEKKENAQYVTELLQNDLMNADRIYITFGDGHKMEIIDQDVIQDIVTQLKRVEVRETKSKAVGFLFYLDLEVEDQLFRIGNEFTFDGKTYEIIGENAQKLNGLIINYGREKFPGLLPGVNAGSTNSSETSMRAYDWNLRRVGDSPALFLFVNRYALLSPTAKGCVMPGHLLLFGKSRDFKSIFFRYC